MIELIDLHGPFNAQAFTEWTSSSVGMSPSFDRSMPYVGYACQSEQAS